MNLNKSFYRVKLIDSANKTLWASIDCINKTVKFVVSKGLFNEQCFDDYHKAIKIMQEG